MARRANALGSGALLLGLALLAGRPANAGDVSVKLDFGSGFSIKDGSGTTERLRVDEATGNISRNGALFVHTTGGNSTFVGTNVGTNVTTGYNNSALGDSALSSNGAGHDNSAVGYAALRADTSGSNNSAFGSRALRYNSTGVFNSAVGSEALRSNTLGNRNSAFGRDALRSNTSGSYNSAAGIQALLSNTTGNSNVAIGRDAGRYQTTGSNNIYLANAGVSGETGKIKIGNTVHTETFIEGIDGNTATGGVAVLINSSNELHTLVSSARFKQDVRDMGEASDLLMKLRPVTFRYREEALGSGGSGEADEREYGLIAEEVADVAPELVARDPEGRPYSVKYHVLPALLVNELQKQRAEAQHQQRANAKLEARISELERKLREEGQR